MTPFAWVGQPGRVVFGAGAVAQLPAEVERLGATRAIVLSTPEQRASAAATVERDAVRALLQRAYDGAEP
jgi:alcohol dehydrogenase class IV